MTTETAILRLKKFVVYAKKKGYIRSEREFELFCGLSNGYLNSMLYSDKGAIGSDKIALIANRFSILNVRWLCTGKGSMINDAKSKNSSMKEVLKLVEKLDTKLKEINYE